MTTMDLKTYSDDFRHRAQTMRRWELEADPIPQKSLYETIRTAFSVFAELPFLGDISPDGKTVTWQTYAQVWNEVGFFSGGLLRLMNEDQCFVGVYSKNRAEWVVADLALAVRGYASVPLPTTLDTASLKYILQHSNTSCVILSKELMPNVLEVAEECPALKFLIQMEPDSELKPPAQKFLCNGRIKLSDYQSLLELGKQKPRILPNTYAEENIVRLLFQLLQFSVMYTSGSTGKPKGAVSSFARWNAFNSVLYLQPFPLVRLSFMPLAHTTERQQLYLTLAYGGRMAFSRGDMDNIFDELKLINPTTMSAAPRFYDKIYSQFQGAVALAREQNPDFSTPELETQILPQFKHVLGTGIQWLIIGGAASSKACRSFLTKCFNCHVYDGYGTTEAGGIASDETLYAGVELKLVDCPDMGYTSQDKPYPRGEITVRTKTMIQGYYKDSNATAENFTPDGYFRTGDIGEMTPSGQLRVIDRKKNLFKLAQGEFIAPSHIENLLLQAEFVDQIYIYGDTLRSFLVAVVVPAPKALQTWAAGQGLKWGSLRELYDKPQIINAILSQIGQLQTWELPAKLWLEVERFTPENGLMTPSEKLVRFACEKKYKPLLEKLYDSKQPTLDTTLSEVTEIVRTALGNEAVASGDMLDQVGTDSLTTVKLLNSINLKFGVHLSINSVLEDANSLLNAETLAKMVESSKASVGDDSLNAVSRIKEAFEDSEAELGLFVRFLEPPRKVVSPLSVSKKVLLTGATGFLGAHILVELLTNTRAIVACLVRGTSQAESEAALLAAMRRWKIGVPENWKNRVKVINGDLDNPVQFGCGHEVWAELSDSIDAIIHSGAVVNWLTKYTALRNANVQSTKILLEFASRSKLKHFIYVSTVSVAGGTEGSLATPTAISASNPYAISKWASEKLVRRAAREGMPTTIVRPGMITASSLTGACNPSDYVGRYFMGCAEMKLAFNAPEVIEFTPVDFVASAVVKLSEEARGQVFHIGNTNTLSFGRLAQIMTAAGLPLADVPYTQWRSKLSSNPKNPLWPLLPFFGETQPSSHRPYIGPTTQAALTSLGLKCPIPDQSMVTRLLQYLATTSALANAPAQLQVQNPDLKITLQEPDSSCSLS